MEATFEASHSASKRSVSSCERDGDKAHIVEITRSFHCGADKIWAALTDKDALAKWFLPISGDLSEGGRFSFKGHASGTILKCEPSSKLEVTWECGNTSWLTCGVDGSNLIVTHTSPDSDHWAKFGPSATGVGWEMAAVSLAAYLHGTKGPTNEEFSHTPHGHAFIKRACDAWALAHIANGETEEKAHRSADQTAAFYTGQ